MDTVNWRTTALGGIAAVATAAVPVMNGVQGSMHQGDWTQLILAVAMALFGYFAKDKNVSGVN